jgi:hypothetical protein
MIKGFILQILEHGTVPAVALALAVAQTNRQSWQRDDLTEPAQRVKKVLFSTPTADTMNLGVKDHQPLLASTKARLLTPATTDHRETN